jgi:alpha-L-fucosidase
MQTQRGAWFKDAKRGMFIHWGLYSQLAGEWKGKAMTGGNKYAEHINLNMRIPNVEYEKVAREFNPVRFDAKEWIGYAKEAGMKYFVITAKHQDGFCMYDTKLSDYNIVMATPFGRDIMPELAEECKKAGIRFGFYYSNARDFHKSGANYNTHGNTWDFPAQTEKDFEEYYYGYAIPQVKELLRNYGDVSVMWFDVPYKITPNMSADLRAAVLKAQPGCIINSRIGNGMGDYFSMEDNNLPDKAMDEMFEYCITMNDTWGYSKHDNNWKTPRQINDIAEKVIGKRGNMLLNVGPKGDGSFPAEAVEILKKFGKTNQ